MNNNHSDRLGDADHLAGITRRYARFSRSAAGLASAIGGGIALLVYFQGALAPPTGWGGRLALASAPFVWIAARELLRQRYYQSFGRVQEIRPVEAERWHLGLTLFTAAVSIGVVGFVAWQLVMGPTVSPGPDLVGYLTMIVLMPWLVWRFMPTPLEFIVGVFLVAQAALMLGGSHYALWDQPHVPVAAVALMVVGVRQHREFRRVRAALQQAEWPV